MLQKLSSVLFVNASGQTREIQQGSATFWFSWVNQFKSQNWWCTLCTISHSTVWETQHYSGNHRYRGLTNPTMFPAGLPLVIVGLVLAVKMDAYGSALYHENIQPLDGSEQLWVMWSRCGVGHRGGHSTHGRWWWRHTDMVSWCTACFLPTFNVFSSQLLAAGWCCLLRVGGDLHPPDPAVQHLSVRSGLGPALQHPASWQPHWAPAWPTGCDQPHLLAGPHVDDGLLHLGACQGAAALPLRHPQQLARWVEHPQKVQIQTNILFQTTSWK